jgi:hypothetical protein
VASVAAAAVTPASGATRRPAAVGLELGQLFARLGTRVTIVEVAGRIAPFDEPEISAAIEDVLDEEGIGIHTGADVTSAGLAPPAVRSISKRPRGVTWSWRAARSWSRSGAARSPRA